jgi:hypothetical protein
MLLSLIIANNAAAAIVFPIAATVAVNVRRSAVARGAPPTPLARRPGPAHLLQPNGTLTLHLPPNPCRRTTLTSMS